MTNNIQTEKVTINGITINAPLRSVVTGQKVWVWDSHYGEALKLIVYPNQICERALQCGRLFATAEDAEAANKAVMLALGCEIQVQN
jgi:hypothetical protein